MLRNPVLLLIVWLLVAPVWAQEADPSQPAPKVDQTQPPAANAATPSASPAPPDPAAGPKSEGFLDAPFGMLLGTARVQDAAETATDGIEAEASVVADDTMPTAKAKPEEDKRIELVDGFDEAVKLSQLEQRPLLVIAGAQWCGWCRKLEQELGTPQADPILKKWVIAKIDVDDSPKLAEEFEVNALPALRVITADRRVAARQEGYMPLQELQAWLDEAAPQADPGAMRVLYDEGLPDAEQLSQLLDFLGHRSPALRQAAVQRLMDARSVAARSVIDVLSKGRLAQKLSALEVLRNWQAPVEGLDPWQPETLTKERSQGLDDWLEKNTATAETPLEPAPEVDPTIIKDTVTRWLQSPDLQRPAIHSQLISYGRAILPELRSRLNGSTELTDKERSQLRQLLLWSLASAKTRGQHGDLLTALASLNAETHRVAAGKVLELLDKSDQFLLDELAQDADPLVRELTVPALQRIEVLQTPERLEKLLSDKSPSVRTAVLREIAQHPDPKSIERLSSYAARETDEDLLVYTAKTLGELPRDTTAEAALCQLLENPSWRVRAAVLDAYASRTGNRFDFSRPGVSKKTFESILKATDDSDAFVVQRALELVPKLVRSNNIAIAVQFLVKRPDQINNFWKAIDEYKRSEIVAGMVGPVMELMESQDMAQVSGAITILTEIKPDGLKHRLPKLLQSSDESVRLAALKGSVAYLAALRKDALEALRKSRETTSAGAQREPWYVAPESFLSLAQPNEEPAVENSPPNPVEEPAAPVPAELAIVDDFFGGKSAAATPPAPTSTPVPADTPATSTTDSPPTGLDLADNFFGDAAATGSLPVAQTALSKAEGNPQAEGNSEGKTQLNVRAPTEGQAVRLSKWQEQWFEKYADDSDDEALKNVRAQLRTMLPEVSELVVNPESSTAQTLERAWSVLANLASGRREFADQLASSKLMHPLDSNSTDHAQAWPVASQILPWLPPEHLVSSIERYQLDLGNDLQVAQKDLLQSLTWFENSRVASWILDQAGRGPVAESNFAAVSDYLTRALRGSMDGDRLRLIPNTRLRGEGPFKEYTYQEAGTKFAIEWLYDQWPRQLNDDQRALLLLQLLRFDFRLGAQSAVGCVAEARQWNRQVQLATVIALAGEPAVVADRAVQWLDHPVPEVRVASANRLSQSYSDYYHETQLWGVPTTQNDTDLPLFFLAHRPMAVDQLKSIYTGDGADSWSAYLLLLASGQAELNDKTAGPLDTEGLLTVAAALAKAKRNDEAALKFYQRAMDEMDWYSRPRLQQVLTNVPGEEAKALRKKLKNSVDLPYASPPF